MLFDIAIVCDRAPTSSAAAADILPHRHLSTPPRHSLSTRFVAPDAHCSGGAQPELRRSSGALPEKSPRISGGVSRRFSDTYGRSLEEEC